MSTMESYDMVVIGAGPAGSMAAKTAAELGLTVLMIERDNVIGSPVRCAEGVDHKGLAQFYPPDPKWIAATIDSYNFVAPNGTVVEMDNDQETGYILERLVFDRMIAEDAASKGANVRTGVEAVGMSDYDNGVRRVTLKSAGKTWEVKAKIVVAADGVESRAARWANIETHVTLKDMETCAQATLANIDINPRRFSMYFTSKFAPGGYAWTFPKGDRVANVGLGISGIFARKKKPVELLNAFIEQYYPGGSIVSSLVGGVACSGGIKKLYADGVMVSGDAAHMANPLTGGGIINSMIAGQIAGETASAALKNERSDERSLSVYQKRCDDRFGKKNRRFQRVKEAVFSIPDERFNDLAEEMNRLPKEKRTPIRALRSVFMKNPKLLTLLPKIVF